MKITDKSFFERDAFCVAEDLIGSYLCRRLNDGNILKQRITELEIYYGEGDSACHARFGKTNRSKTLYESGGITYVYLCYGIHYLFNVVTGPKDHPEAILIRGVEDFSGPGRVTKAMEINKDLHEVDITTSEELWIEARDINVNYKKTPRIGINYASEPYKSILWRYLTN